jgi:hypothetical protein
MDVGGAITVLFSELREAASVDPTLGLRFQILYVAWQPKTGKFVRPGETIGLPEMAVRWELNKADLKLAINALRAELEKPL